MTILVKKVFISSKPTFVYLLCPPLCGPFSIQESAAGGLSYKEKKHPASARCSVKKFQFLPAYIFNVANIIFLISKYYFQLLRYGITRVDLALLFQYQYNSIFR